MKFDIRDLQLQSEERICSLLRNVLIGGLYWNGNRHNFSATIPAAVTGCIAIVCRDSYPLAIRIKEGNDFIDLESR